MKGILWKVSNKQKKTLHFGREFSYFRKGLVRALGLRFLNWFQDIVRY